MIKNLFTLSYCLSVYLIRHDDDFGNGIPFYQIGNYCYDSFLTMYWFLILPISTFCGFVKSCLFNAFIFLLETKPGFSCFVRKTFPSQWTAEYTSTANSEYTMFYEFVSIGNQMNERETKLLKRFLPILNPTYLHSIVA